MSRICHILAIVIVVFAVSAPLAGFAGEISADSSFAFAESLFQDGDYYRSITEYKRFIFHYPLHPQTEKAQLRIAESYFRAKKWREAVDSFTSFLMLFPSSSLRMDAMLMKGEAEKEGKFDEQALKTFQEILREDHSPYSDKALYQSVMIYLEKDERNKALGAIRDIRENAFRSGVVPILRSGIEEISRLPRKSPAVAGTLAAVMPGSGHLYVERPRDALVSFLLNASFLFAAVQFYRHDHYAAAGIAAFFEVGWYGGNIYSAIGSAHKFNHKIKNDFLYDLRIKAESALK